MTGTNAPDSFANDVLSRPRLTRELLADDDNGQAFGPIILIDQSSLEQHNAQRFEVAWTDNPMRSDRNVVRVCRRTTLDLENGVVSNFALQRNVRRRSSRHHARQSADSFEHFVGKRDALAILRIFRIWQHHFHGEEIVRTETQIEMLQPLEALHHQSTANQ